MRDTSIIWRCSHEDCGTYILSSGVFRIPRLADERFKVMINQDLIDQLDKIWIATEDAINLEYDAARNSNLSKLKQMQLWIENMQIDLAEEQEEAEMDW